MNLLFLTSRFPYPIEKGDKLRAYYFIKHLSQYHNIFLFAINPRDPLPSHIEQLKPFCKKIHVEKISFAHSFFIMIRAIAGSQPFQVAYFTSNHTKKKLKHFVAKHSPDKIFCHLIRMAEYEKVIHREDSMLDYMDAFSKGMQRLAEQSSWWKRIFLRIEESRLKKYESKVYHQFKTHLIISKQDAEFIDHPKRANISVIPNGVDFSFYQPLKAEKKYELIFVGNMAYPPNVQAVNFAVKKILPIVRESMPGVKLIIAGANPSASVRNLANDKVIVSGWVENILPVMASAKVMIAPMLISIGLQNKILQAMAMQIPCVISRLANNAIGAPISCVCIADDPAEYAAHIIRLLNNPAETQQMTNDAYQFVKQHFDWQKNIEHVNVLLQKN